MLVLAVISLLSFRAGRAGYGVAERGVTVILAPSPVATGKAPSASRMKAPAGLPPYLASLYGDGTLLNREQEAHLFRKMNYLKHRASDVRSKIDPSKAKTSDLDEIERLQ